MNSSNYLVRTFQDVFGDDFEILMQHFASAKNHKNNKFPIIAFVGRQGCGKTTLLNILKIIFENELSSFALENKSIQDKDKNNLFVLDDVIEDDFADIKRLHKITSVSCINPVSKKIETQVTFFNIILASQELKVHQARMCFLVNVNWDKFAKANISELKKAVPEFKSLLNAFIAWQPSIN